MPLQHDGVAARHSAACATQRKASQPFEPGGAKIDLQSRCSSADGRRRMCSSSVLADSRWKESAFAMEMDSQEVARPDPQDSLANPHYPHKYFAIFSLRRLHRIDGLLGLPDPRQPAPTSKGSGSCLQRIDCRGTDQPRSQMQSAQRSTTLDFLRPRTASRRRGSGHAAPLSVTRPPSFLPKLSRRQAPKRSLRCLKMMPL
jgi:hypothetical protein